MRLDPSMIFKIETKVEIGTKFYLFEELDPKLDSHLCVEPKLKYFKIYFSKPKPR
jgi:hypothetical protein